MASDIGLEMDTRHMDAGSNGHAGNIWDPWQNKSTIYIISIEISEKKL